jgi:enoyl-CoA hydratase/carnithine racemase
MNSKDFQNIQLEVEGRVATLSLRTPEVGNAITDAKTVEELYAAMGSLNDVSVLILTGSGGIFSAGGNLKAMRAKTGVFSGTPSELHEQYRRSVQKVTRMVSGLEMVTIAAVNGHAIGAGCDLALMCDLRIAATNATFAQAFVNFGIVPGDGGAWFLARTVAPHHAADLVFTGRRINAREAQEMGLVNEVVETDRLMARVNEVAAQIASKPPLALRLSKRLLKRALEMRLSDFLEVSATYQTLLHQTEDHREALEAFFEKREGKYNGR